ncbi:hypothetical protein A5643_00315 [Mycobacterium sp. 1274756.6]|nr:hypothetical protein A5643_00315 [Mycobacterium sp. 1274756.6]
MPEVCADDDVMPIMVEAECDGQTQIYGGRGCILYRDIDWPAGWWQIATKQCGYYHSVGETMPDGCFGRPR